MRGHSSRIPNPSLLFLALGGGLLIGGCEGGPEPPAGSPVLDTWVLGEPIVELGSMEGGPDSFSNIRGMALGPEGNLHILLPQEQSIKVFGPTGDFKGAIGRRGEGPGEFTYPNRLGFLGDTLWVLDDRADRMSFFRNGEFLESETYPGVSQFHPDRNARIVAIVAGKKTVYGSDLRHLDQPLATSTPVPMILGGNGLFDTLAFYNTDHVGGFLTQTTVGALSMVRPFVQPFQDLDLWTTAVDGSSVLLVDRKIGLPESEPLFRVHRVSLSGDTICSAAIPYVPTAIPPSHLDSVMTRMAGKSFSNDDVESALFIPPHFPPVDQIMAGQDGTIWLDILPGSDDSTIWMVLNPDCRPLAELEVSGRGKLQIADRHTVWLLTTDDFDVPYLTRHEVSLGAGT